MVLGLLNALPTEIVSTSSNPAKLSVTVHVVAAGSPAARSGFPGDPAVQEAATKLLTLPKSKETTLRPELIGPLAVPLTKAL